MLIGLTALSFVLAICARAHADDRVPDDDDDEVADALARPDVADAPTTADAESALDLLGADDALLGTAGSEDQLEAQAHHARPSPYGRLDLQLEYLHRDSDPAQSPAHAFTEVLVALIWRR